jgi:hypothetical protein
VLLFCFLNLADYVHSNMQRSGVLSRELYQLHVIILNSNKTFPHGDKELKLIVSPIGCKK